MSLRYKAVGGKCVKLIATDEDLEYIRAEFHNLPDSPRLPLVCWTGAFATFIWDNLPATMTDSAEKLRGL